MSAEAFEQDAQRFTISFARDVRALHGHNHDHNCNFTCVKYVKQAAKKVAAAKIVAAKAKSHPSPQADTSGGGDGCKGGKRRKGGKGEEQEETKGKGNEEGN